MSKREFFVIVCAAIALAIALPFMAQWFQPRQAEPEPLPGVPFSVAKQEEPSLTVVRICEARGRCIDSLSRQPVEARVAVLAGAEVVVTWPCDDEGRFEFKFKAANDLRLEIWQYGYETRSVPLSSDDLVDVGLVVLEPFCSVRFYIMENGRRVAPERIIATRLLPLAETMPLRVEVGIPRFGLPVGSLRPGTWRAVVTYEDIAEASDWRRTPAFVSTFTVSEKESEVELRPRPKGDASIVVQARNHRGEPVPAAKLVLETLGTDDVYGIISIKVGDEHGQGGFGELPAGVYFLWATDGTSPDRSRAVSVSVSEHESRVVELIATCKPDVRVEVTRDGKPWANAQVALIHESDRTDPTYPVNAFAETDAAGVVTLKHNRPGSYVLRARATVAELSCASFNDPNVVVAFNRDQTLRIEVVRTAGPTVSVKATVRGEIQQGGVKDVLFCLQNLEAPREIEYRCTGDGLAAQFDSVPPGRYRVWAQAALWVDTMVDGRNREVTRLYATLVGSTVVDVRGDGTLARIELEPTEREGSVSLRNDKVEYRFLGTGVLLLRHPGEPHYAPWEQRSPLERRDRAEVYGGHFRKRFLTRGVYEVLLVSDDNVLGIGKLDATQSGRGTKLVLDECSNATLAVSLQVESKQSTSCRTNVLIRPEWGSVRKETISCGRVEMLSLIPGRTTLEFVTPGFEPAVATVEMKSGDSQSISIKLQPLGVPGVVMIEGITPEEIVKAVVVVSDGDGFALPAVAYPSLRNGGVALILEAVSLRAANLEVYLENAVVFRATVQPRLGEPLLVHGQMRQR